MVATLTLLLGITMLLAGGALLVRGASDLAARFGISPLVIGLTVVAFGTSAPELAVSLRAAVGGRADIALGNVVGSNIFNVLLILGLSALITPLVVAERLVRRRVSTRVPTRYGVFELHLYANAVDPNQHIALTLGIDPPAESGAPVDPIAARASKSARNRASLILRRVTRSRPGS